MSDTHTEVSALVSAPLPRPVPAEEYAACPVTLVARRLGDTWSLLVLALLSRRTHRFNELHRGIEGISQRMLTRTLRSLEDDGLVVRTVHPTKPPSVEYGLTPLGVTLRGPLDALAEWALEHAAELGAAQRHRAAPARA